MSTETPTTKSEALAAIEAARAAQLEAFAQASDAHIRGIIEAHKAQSEAFVAYLAERDGHVDRRFDTVEQRLDKIEDVQSQLLQAVAAVGADIKSLKGDPRIKAGD